MDQDRPSGDRPLRADARRNRDRLVSIAAAAFTAGDPDVTLEAVAREAGVGIGTLYRHFPTREALVEAVYRAELTRLCDAAEELLAAMSPVEALRTWMNRFFDYMTAKRGLAETLREVIASGGDPYAHSRSRMQEAMTDLLRAGMRDGSLRLGTSPDDVLTALNGVALAAGTPQQREQAGRILDLLMAGLRG